jgi:hypothetical protein
MPPLFPTAAQNVVEGHEIPAITGSPGTLPLAFQLAPPFVVVTTELPSIATHAIAAAHEIASALEEGRLPATQLAPPFVVVTTELAPTAAQNVVDGHEIESRLAPAGSCCCVQLVPPSVVATTASGDPRGTAKQSTGLGQEMEVKPPWVGV